MPDSKHADLAVYLVTDSLAVIRVPTVQVVVQCGVHSTTKGISRLYLLGDIRILLLASKHLKLPQPPSSQLIMSACTVLGSFRCSAAVPAQKIRLHVQVSPGLRLASDMHCLQALGRALLVL
jgi:hypothetical protein